MQWIVISVVVGLVMGALYFAGLWWTVARLATTRQPAGLLAFSFLVRTALVLGAFYIVMDGQWQRLVACLAGFWLARLTLTRFWPPVTGEDLSPGTIDAGGRPR